MLELFFKYPGILERMRGGPLARTVVNLASRFAEQGYARETARTYLRIIASFSRYAAAAGCARKRQINESHTKAFIRKTCRSSCARSQARSALAHALPGVLKRRVGGEREVAPSDAVLLARFDTYLMEVRGLRERSREGVIRIARRMLQRYRRRRPGQRLSKLGPKDVLAMLAQLMTPYRANTTRSQIASHVRMFLRHLSSVGVIQQDLALIVPRVPCWRLAHIPTHLTWLEVRRVIDGIDAADPIGKRDRAIMLLLSTTGLRSRELLCLELDDIRWRAGEILLRRTKGRRDRAVPLLDEVGKALAEYVLHGRPQVSSTRIFLCHRPPARPIPWGSTLAAIIRRRLLHCGRGAIRGGARLLRHTLATRMVQQDRPVKEIADLLGHRSIDTTAVYVKVAIPQLTDVALPFPRVAS